MPLRFVDPYHDYVEASIEQVFDAFVLASGGATCGVPITAEAFHGDASADNEVDIVYPAGKFTLDSSEGPQDFQYLDFADRRLLPDELIRERSLRLLFDGLNSPSAGFMCGGRVSLSLFRRESGVPENSRFPGVALLEPEQAPVPGDRDATDSDARGDSEDAFSLQVRSVKVAKIERRKFDGYVYNLETETGFYFADSILVHNCGCSLLIHA
jgi:hypothetical protein